MESYEKEGYQDGDFHLQWFVWGALTKKECKGMPEWEECGGAYKTPQTEKEWKEAKLHVTDGFEIECELEDYDGFIWDIPITSELRNYLQEVGYDIEITITKDTTPLNVSKMGRKKIVNVPTTSKLKAGDKVKITKIKKVKK